ncbi:hypothetical protein QJS10_CPB22g01072 [Acorus calamus]|uniref:ENT domain-containing protein n=1 Tax=Acorus calamus TaxID=4465 RepID=A0AAV9BYF9_ACOCL|nr:hypothetical protein QJS10_CPB22g01072 [Acorus calamus]
MRLKKGSKVEVLKKSNVPPGSWWCAEIVSGNGHTYNVKYDQPPSNISEVIMERVPRKVIRPCPPTFKGAGSWVPGDIVEVFEMSSWKLAEVSRRVSRNHHFVRLLGSSSEFKVHKSFIRVRQSWKDGRWVLIGKDSGKLNNDKLIRPPKADEYHCRKKRRSPLVTCIANGKKLKAAAKDDGCPQLIPECSSHLPEKVDAVPYPVKMLGENYVHTSLYNNTAGFSEMDVGIREPNTDFRCFYNRYVDSSDAKAESSVSSVGSCSPSHEHCDSDYPLVSCGIDRDSENDDAESFCGEHRRKQSELTKGDRGADIHWLELHAYRRTMEALYASGPLSWDQETLMTNLRLMLHISNDEHLSEIRHLVSDEMDS